ncbi:hypothetical protein ACVU7I_05560 [Patulibacter sp. S7RM1-6]
MPVQQDLTALPTSRKLLLGAALLLLVDSFLPWYHVSVGPFSASASGWHQLGTVAWVLLILLLVWEGARVAGVVPVPERRADLYSAAAAGLVVLFGAIFVIQRLADGSLGVGFFLGLVLLVVLAVAAFQAFQAGGGSAAVREVRDEAAARRTGRG